MVYCVAITGSIASGKTLVTQYFSKLGVEVFSADAIAKALTQSGQSAFNSIVKQFGSEILLATGGLNRRALREVIFSDSIQKKWLEDLLHPLIRKRLEHLVASSQSPYCVVEIPLLTDKANYPYINKIIFIDTPQEQQVARVMHRDNCSREQALSIIAAHPKNDVRKKYADIIIINDNEIQALENQVNALDILFLKEASLIRKI